jgi:hypothetical protein
MTKDNRQAQPIWPFPKKSLPVTEKKRFPPPKPPFRDAFASLSNADDPLLELFSPFSCLTAVLYGLYNPVGNA